MNDIKNKIWYKKYNTIIWAVLGLLFLLAFILFINSFFKSDLKNQSGKIFLTSEEKAVLENPKNFIADSGDSFLEITDIGDGLVQGTYTEKGLVKEFTGRYSEDKKKIYITVSGENINVEEIIFKLNNDGSVGVGKGKKFLGKNGISIYENIEEVDFSSTVLIRHFK